MKPREYPKRLCVACMQMKDKRELFRVVKTKDGTVNIDPTHKAAGRGAYICKSHECIKLAAKKKALSHALKGEIPTEIYMQLESEINN